MRTSIKEIRRQDLVKAAYLTLKDNGMQGLTIKKVAERAQMSPGIVHHYFKDKRELTEATIRYSNGLISKRAIEYLNTATTPDQRLYAVIQANFDPDIYEPRLAQTWLSYCAAVADEPVFGRIQRALRRRLISNLVSPLRQLAASDDVRAIAHQIAVMIDGLWVQRGMDGEAISPDTARDCVLALLRRSGINASPPG